VVLLMSGITRKNQAGVSGLVGAVVHFSKITSTGTDAWTKPDNVSVVWIECVGGGGSGGTDGGSGGGGGGAFAWACFSAAALPSALDAVIGAGGDVGSTAGDGAAGGATDVNIPSGETEAGKIILRAFGGGGGCQGSGDLTSGGGGGGGGGTGGVGSSTSDRAGANGGNS
jgi:hypothetical protein